METDDKRSSKRSTTKTDVALERRSSTNCHAFSIATVIERMTWFVYRPKAEYLRSAIYTSNPTC